MSTAGNPLSLAVKGGAFVIPGIGLIDAYIGIARGRIAVIGESLPAEGAYSLSACRHSSAPNAIARS